jgi:type IV pilus assembly protein PilM
MINWRLKIRSVRPIGLDIGHNSIKMLQLVIKDEHISVLATEKATIDPDINGDWEQRRRFVVLTLKQMLTEGSFHGRNVVSCLPNDALKMTSLRLAETEMDQIEQILQKEAAQRFGLDPEKDAIKHVLAGNVRQGDEVKTELILFAADSRTIKTHISMLEESGLKPVGVDVVPCALFRNFERLMRRHEDKERTVIFIDVGGKFTTLVFGRGSDICFVKQIPIGAEIFNQQVAAKLGISPKEAEMLRLKLQLEKVQQFEPVSEAISQNPSAQDGQPTTEQQSQTDSFDPSTRQLMVDAISSVAEQLAKEVSLCFRYYTVTFRGRRVERVILAGGGANENILLDVLRRQLALEIEVAEPLRGFDLMNMNIDSDRRGLFCEWAVAVGLSLKGWSGTPVQEPAILDSVGFTKELE